MTIDKAIEAIAAFNYDNSTLTKALEIAIEALKEKRDRKSHYYCPCCGGKIYFGDLETDPPISDKKLYKIATISETIGDLQYILDEYGDVNVYVDTPDDDTGVVSGVISVKPYFINGYEQAMIFTELEANMIPFFDREDCENSAEKET